MQSVTSVAVSARFAVESVAALYTEAVWSSNVSFLQSQHADEYGLTNFSLYQHVKAKKYPPISLQGVRITYLICSGIRALDSQKLKILSVN